MTINIISDLHCGYNLDTKSICWNRLIYKKHDNVTNKDIITSDEEYVKYRKEDAIYRINEYKKDIINQTEKFLQFDYSNLEKKKDYCYFNTYKCKSFNQCIEYLDKIIKYLKSNNYSRARNMFDICRCIEHFIDQVCPTVSSYTLREVKNVFLRRCCDFVPERLKPADYLIVAGDLGLDISYRQVYKELKERTKHLFKDVFFIKGNHDYWCFADDPIFRENINLEDRFFEKEIENYLFLGCTMWAPVQKGTWQERCVVRTMNDYNYIPLLNVDKVNQLYNEESNWLRKKVQSNPDKKIIIFTHHNPIQDLIDDDYKHSDVNAAYAVLDHSCDDIKPYIWICGHSHSYKDITKNGVRYIRNPIGYRESYGYLPSECSSKHWYNTIIEI